MITPWYSGFAVPQLPPSPNLFQYLFQDKALEQQVYAPQAQWLGVDNGTSIGNENVGAPRKENEALRWLGECVLRGLTGVLLVALFPDLEASAFEHLRVPLQTKTFYAHLARVIGLHNNLVALTYAASDSDHILGSLFASYIGAIHKDMGVAGFSNLHSWFSQLVGPYAQAYRLYYEQYTATKPIPPPNSMEMDSHTQDTSTQSTVAMDTTGLKPASMVAKLRRQHVSMYTSRLMEYAAKNHLSQPSFAFRDNGYQGALIQWTATVGINGSEIATAVATTKLEAKHLASREALVALRAPMVQLPSINNRKTKKMISRRMVIG